MSWYQRIARTWVPVWVLLGVLVGMLIAAGSAAPGCAGQEPALRYATCVARCSLDCLDRLEPAARARLRLGIDALEARDRRARRSLEPDRVPVDGR